MSRMTKEEVKQRVCKAIVDAQPRLRELAESIMAEPELGFKEVKTSKKVQAMFDELGISYTTGHALTGVKGRMKGRDSKYTVAMVGELDAILCPRHPRADDLTGAAHCCGHNVQITNMFAVAMGLQAVMNELAGDVVLFAVPAEEMIEIDYRNKLLAGDASLSDPEVKRVFSLWHDLIKADFFNPHPNEIEFDSGAAKMVRNGEAAMTLMGTWLSGYFQGMKPVWSEDSDYGFFPFPTIDPAIPRVALGPIDGLIVPKSARNIEGAKSILKYFTIDPAR